MGKEFRFQNAEVVSVEPLMIRTGANPGLNLWIDGQDVGAYLAEEEVRVHVVGVPGSVRLHGTPSFTGDHGATTTEVFFEGTAEVWVGERDLVVRMPGVQGVGVEIGAAALPADEGTLNGAGSLGWVCDPVLGTAKEFRIRGAEVVSAEPLVIRVGANSGVTLWLDGEERGTYSGEGDVRLFVIADPGAAGLPGLPELEVDYGATTTELTILGASHAWVEEQDLVIQVPGARELVIEAGADLLPVDRAQVEAASIYGIESDLEIGPHQPKRQP